MVNVTTYMFADHLRGTPFLTWWFRAMVSLCHIFPCLMPCLTACIHMQSVREYELCPGEG